MKKLVTKIELFLFIHTIFHSRLKAIDSKPNGEIFYSILSTKTELKAIMKGVCYLRARVKAPMYKALTVYIMNKRWISWLCFKQGDFSIFTGKLLIIGRVVVISLVMGLVGFSRLHERFVSTRNQCIINNYVQNSQKYESLHPRQRIEEYCFSLSSKNERKYQKYLECNSFREGQTGKIGPQCVHVWLPKLGCFDREGHKIKELVCY